MAEPFPETERGRGSVSQLAVASYLAMLLGLVTGPLLARAVGPSGRGEIAGAVVYSGLAAMVLSLGMPLALSHTLANKLHHRSSVLASAFRYAVITTSAAVLLGVLIVLGPLQNLGSSAKIGAAILLAAVPVAVLANCLKAFFTGEGMLRGLTFVRVIPIVVTTALVVITFVTGLLNVVSYPLIVVAGLVLEVVIAKRHIGAQASAAAPLRPLIRFGLRGYMGYLAVYASIRVDQAFIGPILGTRELGFYAVSATVALLPFTLARAIGSRAFALVARSEGDDRLEHISKYLRLTLLVTVLFCAVIGLASPTLLPLLYGDDFAPALTPLLLLLPGTVFLCGSLIANLCLTAVGLPGRATIAELVGFAVAIVGLPLVIPRFGITGAAILSAASYAAAYTCYRWFLHELGPVRALPTFADVGWLVSGAKMRIARRAAQLPLVNRIVERRDDD